MKDLRELLDRYTSYLIVSPPRCASTALARALFQHSAMGTYIHEPCDRYCHDRQSVESVTQVLIESGLRTGTLIKEMTFQWDRSELYQVFLNASKQPVIFLVRDPLLTLESRLRQVANDLISQSPSAEIYEKLTQALKLRDYRELNDVITNQIFPQNFTGWDALRRQIRYCRKNQIPIYVLVADNFRSEPEKALRQICAQWGLPFEPSMLSWSANNDFSFGRLPTQSSWYHRVASSEAIQPPTETPVSPDKLPERFQRHLDDARRLYEKLIC